MTGNEQGKVRRSYRTGDAGQLARVAERPRAFKQESCQSLGRTPIEQARRNLESALRALAMAPRPDAGQLYPHPLDVVGAELRNALAFLAMGDDASA